MAQAPSSARKPPTCRWSGPAVAFKATRIGQALGGLVRHVQKRPLNQSEWGGMVMFLHNHVRQDDPRMATVYASFEHNLNDIIDTGLRGGAKVLVSTVARNLKDCGPFASDHRPGLPAEELSRWDNLYQTESGRKRRGGWRMRSAPFSRR